MENFRTIEGILDFAIAEEERAYQFYTQLAGRAANPAMREALEGFAREELGHKAKLEAIKLSGKMTPADGRIADLSLADVLVTEEPSADMDYQTVLIIAMKKEKAAFQLYTSLAQVCPDASLRATFEALALEEARHKLRFEIEYDEVVLKED